MLEQPSLHGYENEIPPLALLKDIREFLEIDDDSYDLNERMDFLELEIFRLLKASNNGQFPPPLQALDQQYIDLYYQVSNRFQDTKRVMEVMLLHSLANVIFFKVAGRFEDAVIELSDAREIFDHINPNKMGALFLEVMRF